MLHFIKALFHTPYFGCFLSLFVCSCFYYLKGENKPFKKYVWALYFSIFAGTFFVFIGSAIYRIYHPQVWDFTAFYLYGKAAASGYDFYLPANFHSVFSSLNLPSLSYTGFIDEVV